MIPVGTVIVSIAVEAERGCGATGSRLPTAAAARTRPRHRRLRRPRRRRRASRRPRRCGHSRSSSASTLESLAGSGPAARSRPMTCARRRDPQAPQRRPGAAKPGEPEERVPLRGLRRADRRAHAALALDRRGVHVRRPSATSRACSRTASARRLRPPPQASSSRCSPTCSAPSSSRSSASRSSTARSTTRRTRSCSSATSTSASRRTPTTASRCRSSTTPIA